MNSPASDWKAKHPFFVGQLIYALKDLPFGKAGVITEGSAVTVYMRGCDTDGNWVGLKGYAGAYFDCCDFKGAPSPVMIPVVAADEELAA
jgi:hypothetical protein